jgi:IS5 family transposase
MRARRTAQVGLLDCPVVDHPAAATLERVSAWLDEHREVLEWVSADIDRGASPSVGRQGLTCETILRCAVLKHLWQQGYRELAFTLRDSLSAQRFARLGGNRAPGKSALQALISAIRPATWERINRRLLRFAQTEGIEPGETVRIDSTVTETHILSPEDSRLLLDGVRVLTRLLKEARKRLGTAVVFHDHRRACKRRALEVRSRRGAKLLERVVDRTRRRVLRGETVPAPEKVASLFEPHTDIIRKGGRRTYYGHKINLATGKSGLVLDVVVESGNPADSERCLPMLKRHVAHYGSAPERAALNGGYGSRNNLEDAKALGVVDVVFHKKGGLKADQMARSSWIYGQLKRFRAGIEAGISYLKRCFGLARCNWKGLTHFRAYVHSAVLAHNLIRLARLQPGST